MLIQNDALRLKEKHDAMTDLYKCVLFISVVVENPMCQDMEDPSATPYSNGQVVRSGECNTW